jgi:lysophospholipase L1-like esterase
VARLRSALSADRVDAELYNLSVMGDDTYDAILRLGPELTARNGTIVVLHVGLNDSQLCVEYPGPKVPPPAFAANLDLLLRRALRLTPLVVHVDIHQVDEARTTPCAWDRDRSFRADQIRAYRELAAQVCARRGVLRVDPDTLFGPACLVDGVHPGPDGHAALAAAVRGALAIVAPSLGSPTREVDGEARGGHPDRPGCLAAMLRHVDRPGPVVAIGCGEDELRALLPAGTALVATERWARGAGMLGDELRAAPFPRTGARIALLVGALEHVDDVPRLLAELFHHPETERVVMAYATTDLVPALRDRRDRTRAATPWRSHASVKEIVAAARRGGFAIAGIELVGERFVFVLDRRS